MEFDMRVDRVLDLIDRRGLTLAELSKKATGNNGTVRDIVKGKVKSPQYVTIRNMAQVLGCSVKYLTGESDVMVPKPDTMLASADVDQPVAAGIWREQDDVFESHSQKFTVAHPQFKGKDLKWREVQGDSMNKLVPDGGFVITVPFPK